MSGYPYCTKDKEEAVMSNGKLFAAVLFFCLLILAAPLFADIDKSVLTMLTGLSRDYVEYREEVFFKSPLAVVPFINAGPLAAEHEIGALVDELIRSEISNSTYFILTERKNLEKILEEIELSLSDVADTSEAVEVGQLTSATVLLAGSVTEAGSNFLLNGRLIDVETGVVIGARSVPVPKDELISEAQAFKYEYVTRYGLGLQALAGIDIPIGGIPRMDYYESFPTLIHTGAGVSYRPWRFLQISASMNVTWTELQYGAFDPTSADYKNTSWLTTYYLIPLSSAGWPSYTIEYSQKYLDLEIFYVMQPVQKLALSLGGGGCFGLYTNRIELKNFPVYIGLFSGEPPAGLGTDTNWIDKSVTIHSGNAMLYGLLAGFKAEYFLSPRVSLYLNLQYRKVFGSLAFDYFYGGDSFAEDEQILQLSRWIPGITPYGDDLDISFHSLGLYLGISGSF